MIEKIKKHTEVILVVSLLVISTFVHGYNMFNYPYYENDEGTYVSQALAVTEQGKLAPYTYWYDHAPGGWFLIAMWTQFTGGYFTFGNSINTGRVLMLFVHIASVILLYGILRRTGNKRLYSFLGGLLFATSPLAIAIGRRVLLDPMMTMWVLASVFVLLADHRKLRHYLLSAIFFAFAVLTKEPAVFFLPALLYLVYTSADLRHRRIVFIKWVVVFGVLVSLYPMYALMKGEFFPYGSLLGGPSPHVSLLGTVVDQAERKTEGNFWDLHGGFQMYFRGWINDDPVLMISGLMATIFVLVTSFWTRKIRVIVALSLGFWIFLIRGGVLIEFYIYPLLPLLAACVAISANSMARLSKDSYIFQTILILLIIMPTSFFYSERTSIYTKNQTIAQTQALEWVWNNIPNDAFILIDNYAYVDITYKYPKAHYYWKAEVDPAVRNGVFGGKWSSVDYILSTGQIERDTARENFTLVGGAMKNSVPVKSFERDGYAVTIRKVVKPVIPGKEWSYYTRAFIEDGRAKDPYTQNRTTSEGQSYLLLRAVWNDDKIVFDRGWNWTKDHMQYRLDDKLFSWLWGVNESGVYSIRDYETASDADQDIALALLFAYKQWGDTQYLDEAKTIIDDIWKQEVVKVNEKNYLVANTNARRGDVYLLNSSYLSPATYRIFADVDTAHDWMSVVDSSYNVLTELSVGIDGKLQLPTDWIILDVKTETMNSAVEYISQTANRYGYDAFRVMWRVALDARWYHEPRAEEYLRKYHDFFSSEWKEQKLVSIYMADGQPVSSDGNISTDVGALSVLTVTDKDMAEEFYKNRIASKYNEEGYWEEKSNYYGQNWAWFGIALQKDFLRNLWINTDNDVIHTVL